MIVGDVAKLSWIKSQFLTMTKSIWLYHVGGQDLAVIKDCITYGYC